LVIAGGGQAGAVGGAGYGEAAVGGLDKGVGGVSAGAAPGLRPLFYAGGIIFDERLVNATGGEAGAGGRAGYSEAAVGGLDEGTGDVRAVTAPGLRPLFYAGGVVFDQGLVSAAGGEAGAGGGAGYGEAAVAGLDEVVSVVT
jgi:general secretion pathway protein D